MQQLLLTTVLFVIASTERPPNIVFILTDDQDVQLGGMTPLTNTNKLIADKGITFANAFSTTPICCPSRSSILTGLYLHSHGTVNNSYSGGCSNHKWQSQHEGKTFGSVLHKTGYRTFYGGKYLNTYGSEKAGGVKHVPNGWDWWIGLVGNSAYYNYTLSVNGSAIYKGDHEDDYLTDVLKKYSLDFLNQKRSQDEPFLMVVATPSPHEPFTPANRHKGKFSGYKAPRTPTFNLPVNKTKHWLLTLPPDILPPRTVAKIDEAFRDRWESLLAVDELVRDVILKLEEIQVLNNTYLIFSSDHGFHLGQFGLPWDKRQPYETDIRIPLMIRGPQIMRRTSDDPVLNIDLAATILHMGGIKVKTFGDGKSFLNRVNPNGRMFLIEYEGEGGGERNKCYDDKNVSHCRTDASCKCFDARNNTFTCLRRVLKNVDDIYCKFKDGGPFIEFYDIRTDPHEIRNLGGDVRTDEHERILYCCEKMIRMKKTVDKCFDVTTLTTEDLRQRMRFRLSRTGALTSLKRPRGFEKKRRRDFFTFLI